MTIITHQNSLYRCENENDIDDNRLHMNKSSTKMKTVTALIEETTILIFI